MDLQSGGTQTTQSFTTSGGEWAISWAYDCSDFGTAGGFDIEIQDIDSSAGFLSPGVSDRGLSNHGVDYEHTGGTFYLQVISNYTWHIIVSG